MQLWEESDVHIPLANYARLISNGRHFSEVYWRLQPQLIQAELVSPGPALQACPPNAVLQKAEPSVVEPAMPAQESRGTSLAPMPSPKLPSPKLLSPKHSPQPSRASSRASSCRPSTPRMDQVAPRSPSVVPTRTPTPSLSDEEAMQVIKAWIEHSRWLREDEKEPTVGAPGVPICALQLAEKGQSVYCCFLVSVRDRKGKILGYKSASDPNSTLDRLHRAIGRERVKYGHRPFKCPRNHDASW